MSNQVDFMSISFRSFSLSLAYTIPSVFCFGIAINGFHETSLGDSTSLNWNDQYSN